MATLTRAKNTSTLLDLQIPTPFPKEQLVQSSLDTQSRDEDSEMAINPFEGQAACEAAENPFENEAGPSNTADSGMETPNTFAMKEVLPSIIHVQKSCLMTLNNLLSEPIGWHPIVPQRRHSMPSTPVDTTFQDKSSPLFALQTLVSNLRNDSSEEMIEIRTDSSEASLLQELRTRVESISPSLSPNDAALTTAIVNLLTNLHHLSNIQTNVSQLPKHSANKVDDKLDSPPPMNVFDTLSRNLSDLQIERLSSQAVVHSTQDSQASGLELETSLLWSQIDADLETVVALCKNHAVTLPKDCLPPQYDMDDLESLPDYDSGGQVSLEGSKSPKVVSFHGARPGEEKMRMDLESVAMAIERLYLVAPQLHNQRVELKSSKLAELEKLERARAAASTSWTTSTKAKEMDEKELERIVEMIGKASARTMVDQSIILDGDMQQRMIKAKQNESAKRDAFVEQLLHHSQAGRLHNQDAILQVKDPEALLSLPEFIREAVPEEQRRKDGEALLSLPEFVNEPIPVHISSKMYKDKEGSVKRHVKQRERSRSLSTPPFSWLLSSTARTTNGTLSAKADAKGKSKMNNQGFDVIYVAENHENLQHILVFFNITGGTPDAELQAEVLPLLLNLPMDGGDHLLIKSGPCASLPLMLPAHTNSGRQEVRVQRGHYEIKLLTSQSSNSSSSFSSNTPPTGDNSSTPLLDAPQLSSLKPISFVCSSCSLPLIQSSKIDSYRDLPSEHWEELVEAWMCHGDQKLNDHVAKHGKRGFWPSVGQALVGGSYMLFEEGVMNISNLHVAEDNKDDNWRLSRCLCGALIGRCQERESDVGRTKVYRVLKYAVRPVGPTSEPLKIPLSAFVVQDMMEFVQAHASYRFVIQDEEEGKPRILIWLFKPKIRLAYTAMRHHAIPKSANILAAKVLFKLLGPNDRHTDIKSILSKFPGFPQAEYLSYPMSACRHIAAMLNDSNSAYPEGLRIMTGLEVGWLQRM